MRHPGALAAIPLLAGAAAGVLLPIHGGGVPLSAAAAGVLALLAGCASVAADSGHEATLSIVAGFLFAGCALGSADARAADHTPVAHWLDTRSGPPADEPVTLEGVLLEDASSTDDGTSLWVDVEKVGRAGEPVARVSGGVRLSIGGGAVAPRVPGWRAGRRVRVQAFLREPTAYRNFGVPDAARSLVRRGVALVGSVKSAALVETVNQGPWPAEATAAARAWARTVLERHVGCWSARGRAVAAAILIGDRSGLTGEDERRLQIAGTYHVIAISGGNIAILTGLLLAMFRLLRVPARAASATTIAVLVVYGELAGGGASVSRAVLAGVAWLSGRVFDHRGPALNTLATAAIAVVAHSALAVVDAGFLLSFGATLGILLGVPRLQQRATDRRPGPAPLRRRAVSAAAAMIAATLCAELALLPIAAILFSRITFAGLVLNFAAIPLMSVAQCGAMATLAAAPFGDGVATAFGYLTHVAIWGLVESARLADWMPWLSREVAPPAWWLVGVFYAGCLVPLWSARWRRTAVAVLAATVAVMLWCPPFATAGADSTPRGRLRVVFLDVGQGDATLALLPGGRVLLVDAGGVPGGAFDIGQRVVAPAVRAQHVLRLDILAITHGDPDHIGGAPSVLRGFRPSAVWEGIPVPPHPSLVALAQAAAQSGASWRNVQAGDSERAGQVLIRVLHPGAPDWERQRVRNNDSIVLELRLGGVSIVLPGDIEREGESEVLPRLALAPTVVLKAPHHGSATSSTERFLEAMKPAVVVVSAGRANRFGHPAPIVLGRYRRLATEVFRTDQDGAVVVETDGQRVWVRTWSGRRWTSATR